MVKEERGEASAGALQWFGIRCVFRDPPAGLWASHDLRSGESAYEERITLWRAASAEEAIERGEAEAREYASALEHEYLGLAQSYRLADEPGDGAEVFSLIRESRLPPGDYLDTFFDTGSECQRSVQGE